MPIQSSPGTNLTSPRWATTPSNSSSLSLFFVGDELDDDSTRTISPSWKSLPVCSVGWIWHWTTDDEISSTDVVGSLSFTSSSDSLHIDRELAEMILTAAVIQPKLCSAAWTANLVSSFLLSVVMICRQVVTISRNLVLSDRSEESLFSTWIKASMIEMCASTSTTDIGPTSHAFWIALIAASSPSCAMRLIASNPPTFLNWSRDSGKVASKHSNLASADCDIADLSELWSIL